MTDSLFMTGATAAEVWPLLRDHHYLGRKTADPILCFAWRDGGGLFGDHGEPQAAIVYTAPINRYFGDGAVELARLVRKPDFTKPLSQFVSWSLRWMKKNTKLRYCLSYADSGVGHHGGIYQACSFDYVMMSKGHSHWENPLTGETCSARAFDQRRHEYREGWVRTSSSPKYLYVRAITERRNKLLSRFGWEPLPYPKPQK